MDKDDKMIYLSLVNCLEVNEARKAKGLTFSELGELVDMATSTLCRLCNGSKRRISLKSAQAIECVLGIYLYDVFESNEDLFKEIKALREENRRLKQLLMDKWSKDEE